MKFKKHSKPMFVAVGVVVTTGILLAIVGIPIRSSSFSFQGTPYECSKDISGKLSVRGFEPNDMQEFDKFCRLYKEFLGIPDECLAANQPGYCATIEYRAVLDILRRDDVAQVIEKYDTTRASVRAVRHTYIDDKDYLKRILPAYDAASIDCIIVVDSPEGTRFFIEIAKTHVSHDDHRYLEVPAKEFLTSLNKASDEDVTNFWLGLH